MTRKGVAAVRVVVSGLAGVSAADDLALEVVGAGRQLALAPAAAAAAAAVLGPGGAWSLAIPLPDAVDAASVRAKLTPDGRQLTVTGMVRG